MMLRADRIPNRIGWCWRTDQSGAMPWDKIGGSQMVGQGKVLEQHRLATDGRVAGPKSFVAIWYVEYEESTAWRLA